MPFKDPADHREYVRQWTARRRTAWFAEHGPCVDCGSWNDLQLDHVDAATKVSHRVWSWSEARRLPELAKCVARCRPCHLKKTVANHENPHGESTGTAKLSAADVAAIRSAEGTLRDIAARHGISKSQAGRIRRRERWTHI
jgi:hypothetical protein